MRRIYLLIFTAICFAATDPAWIVDKGGAVAREKSGKITGVDLRASWVTDSDIADLAKMPDLKSLDLSLSRISDHGLRSLRTAPAITDLNLYFAEQITDD